MSDNKHTTELVVALTTAPKREVAEMIAGRVLDLRLCACVQLIPGVQSVYEWQGKRCTEEETLVVMKTTAAKISELERSLRAVHPYDTPEFVVLNAHHVSEAYAEWVRVQVQSAR